MSSLYPHALTRRFDFVSEVKNLAAARAHIGLLHAEELDISLQILPPNEGETLIEQPNGGILTNNAFQLKGLVAGAGIDFDINDDSITIKNANAGSAVTLTSAGGAQTLVNDGVGPDLAIAGLSSSAGITLTPTGVPPTKITIGSDIALSSVGAGESLINDGTIPTLALKSLVAGTDISLVSAATTVTVNNTVGASAVTLTSAGGDETIVKTGAGPALVVKGLSEGAGINLTSTANDVTITNSNTLVSTVTGSSIVEDGIVPLFRIKGITDSLLLQAVPGGAGNPFTFDNKAIRITDAAGLAPPLVGASASSTNNIAIGPNASVTFPNAVAIGQTATATAANALALGSAATSTSSGAITISGGSTAYTNSVGGSVAIGATTGVTNTYFASNPVWAGVPGRFNHRMPLIYTAGVTPYPLLATDMNSAVVFAEVGTVDINLDTAVNLFNNCPLPSSWWKDGMGFDLYVRNNNAGVCTIHSATGWTFVDEDGTQSAPPWTTNVPGTTTHYYRAIKKGDPPASTFYFFNKNN